MGSGIQGPRIQHRHRTRACIAEAPEQEAFERADRLPLARARREAKASSQASTRDFVRHVWSCGFLRSMSIGASAADWRTPGREERPFSGCASLWKLADGSSLQHLPASRPQCTRGFYCAMHKKFLT